MTDDWGQWSSIRDLVRADAPMAEWIPDPDKPRLAAYFKYDEMYWNDPKQYTLRVLDGETPLYIPNARTVVDTTSYYLLKGLEIVCDGNAATKKALETFLKREAFYSRFNSAKQGGIARGDWILHLTGNPNKAQGSRLSLVEVNPHSVFPIYDENEPDLMIGCDIAAEYPDPDDKYKSKIKKLTYTIVYEGSNKRIQREEALYELNRTGLGKNRLKKVKQLIPPGLLDSRIDQIPVFWFRNKHWSGEDFGSSELRGLETIYRTISQGATDVSAALALEGLGVYATDGGRPIDANGHETEWEVAPGRVMEVPSGAYFRRVDGVGSITPAVDNIKYLERKASEANGLSDIALGNVEANVASSGIALAIRFVPTLARIETRDQHGIDILTQLFYNWKTWYEVFEQVSLDGDIIPSIGDKLPTDRQKKVEELNNMLDRRVISTSYYREEMQKLGYKFPQNIQNEIDEDLERAKALAQQTNSEDEESENDNSTDGDTLPDENESNNRRRTNESNGTEVNQ